MREIEALCCGDVDSVLSLSESLTTSRALGITANPSY
jgi:hypothetical protein